MTAMKCCPRLRRTAYAGFTLIELMVVVAMVGVLAALAFVGYRVWIRSARTGETKDLVQAIMYGQHTYYADTEGYLNCSSSWTDYYPMAAAPDGTKHPFNNPSHADYSCWRLLTPDSDSPTYAAFTVRAGTSSEAPPQPPTVTAMTNWPPATWKKPWYVVLATADQDGMGTKAYWVGSAFQPNSVYSENESE